MDKKYTPGPWRWEISEKSKDVNLCGGKPTYDKTVMDFVRYGMGGAAPRFNTVVDSGYNIMQRCELLAVPVKGREHHKHWFKTLSHPDAQLIAAAPDLLEALQSLLNVDELDIAAKFKAEQQALKAITRAIGIGAGTNGVSKADSPAIAQT